MRIAKRVSHIILMFVVCVQLSHAQAALPANGLTITITGLPGGSPLPYALVALSNGEKRISTLAASSEGVCIFRDVPDGSYSVAVSYIGYKTLQTDIEVGKQRAVTLTLEPDLLDIEEVVVTAAEIKSLSTTSRISRDAMEHFQPSSFSDLLSLLPGGKSYDPSFGSPNTIKLRSVPGKGSSDKTSSLGTSFIIDGAPISTNANMQYISSESSTSISDMSFVNAGVDMRSISTDAIEVVDIIRGIPSAEYGDLTSGVVMIDRKKGGHNITARFKADMSSKMYYAGKGFEADGGKKTLNIDMDFLDAKADPRNLLKNYKRMTASLRGGTTRTTEYYKTSLSMFLDYTGSLDNVKQDPELNSGQINEYKSSYNRFAWGSSLSVGSRREKSFFREFRANASVSYQLDEIKRRRHVSTLRPTPMPISTEPGVSDAVILPGSYIASHRVDGRPFNAYFKSVAVFEAKTNAFSNNIKVGTDWRMDKNYGDGQVFDMTRPMSPGISTRPRAYHVIPATHNLAFFAEDLAKLRMGDFTLSVMAGLRAAALFNLGKEYDLNGKFHFDPRLNVRLALPEFTLGNQVVAVELSGGAGKHTKFPTISQLFPAELYYDFQQLNYFHETEPSLRRINLMTYIVDPTNYSLEPAKNIKYEARLDVSINGNDLMLTWFREDMRSGFRSSSRYDRTDYRKYDVDAYNDAIKQTGAPADLSTIPYADFTGLFSYSTTTNGSRTLKNGMEWVFSSKRIEVINTRLTISGAWFKTTYENSQMVYKVPLQTTSTYPKYIGIYDEKDTSEYQWANTNFMFDTFIPRFGMGISMAFECVWYVSDNFPEGVRYPSYYMDTDLNIYPFTEESANDPSLRELIIKRTSNSRSSVPFSMGVNLKVTKKLFRDKATLALFVNKLFDCSPDYTRNGFTYRRSQRPYFGMELNIKI